MKTNKIQEVQMRLTDFNKNKGKLSPEDKKTLTLVPDDAIKPGVMEEDDILEPEAVITPQDDATIKYLSNVKDSKTGKVSQPFTIGAQKYQMVRGITPAKEIVMAVFCHNEMDDAGNNIIHPIEHFEKNIIQPMMEKEVMAQQKPMFGGDIEEKVKPEPKGTDSLNLSEFKHYLVNEKTGKFKKFKNVVELAAAVMSEDEKYMSIKEFKRFFEERVFGGKAKRDEVVINEMVADGQAAPTAAAAAQPVAGAPTAVVPGDDDKSVLALVKLLIKNMDNIPLIQKNLAKLAKSKNYKIKTQALNAFLERINIKPNDVPKYLATIKNLGAEIKQNAKAGAPAAATPATGAPAAANATTPPAENQLAPLTEKKVITKTELTENLLKPKVIKTIKIKDIK
jgi:hypothetical protein